MRTTQIDPSVSVVIPHYNGIKYLRGALLSVRGQKYGEQKLGLEIIVVDDGSEPDQLVSLRKLAREFCVVVLYQANSGQSAARNAGVAAASTKYVMFLDQDDVYLPHHVELLVEAMESGMHKPGLAYGDAWESNEAGLVSKHSMYGASPDFPRESVQDIICRDSMILPSNVIVLREAFNKAGGFNEGLRGYEDDYLWLSIFSHGYSLVSIREAVSIYRRHDSNSHKSIQMRRSAFQFFTLVHELIKEFPSEYNTLLEVLVSRLHSRLIQHVVNEFLFSKGRIPLNEIEVVEKCLRVLQLKPWDRVKYSIFVRLCRKDTTLIRTALGVFMRHRKNGYGA